ncbi:MAG: potassium/proton antiporter [Acidimicrobiales bacterium]|nr:potassium/proton antiporter [Acidimicrobiales bacterium]
MISIEPTLLVAAGLVLVAALGSKLAARVGFPALLLFLGLGMLAGSDGPGGIDFDNAELAQGVGVAALALILFDGGLSTRWSTVRTVLGPGITLASVGVIVSALVTGLAASVVLDLDLEVALLLGAIVSSTDAAAVFAVLRARRTGLAGSIQPTLELESGSNDPMAVLLTITLVEVVIGDASGPAGIALGLVQQLVLGGAVGLAAGWSTRWLLNRLRPGADGLYPVLTLSIAVITYAGAVVMGGSGFIAVYLAGLWIGNHEVIHKATIRRFHDAIAWLCQIGMFLLLGLLVFPSELLDVALPALGVAAALVFLARPLATLVCLLPFRVPLRHQGVVAWVGLRGATPIVLATFPLLEGVPDADLIFDVVFFVVLVSVLVQGTTITPVARLFRALRPAPPEPESLLEPGRPLPDGTSLREVSIPATSPVAGRALVDAQLPRDALVVLVQRGADQLVPTGSTRLEGSDRLLVLADEVALDALQQRLRPAEQS